MGQAAGWMKELIGRVAMRSPVAPSRRRKIERHSWEKVATGITSDKAAEVVGISSAVGTHWFRRNSDMPNRLSINIQVK